MMAEDSRSSILEATIATIQKQWGQSALRRLSEIAETAAYLSTGIPELTAICPDIPVGHISELLGAATSGKRTLAYRVIAAAQHNHAICLYIDLDETFDPMQAAYHQVEVEKLILIRPANLIEAFTLAYELITRCQIGLLVVDAATPLRFDGTASKAVRRLITPLGQKKSTLLLLTEAAHNTDFQCRQAVLQLTIERQHWLNTRADVTGYQAKVTVVRNKLGRSGQQGLITIEVGQA